VYISTRSHGLTGVVEKWLFRSLCSGSARDYRGTPQDNTSSHMLFCQFSQCLLACLTFSAPSMFTHFHCGKSSMVVRWNELRRTITVTRVPEWCSWLEIDRANYVTIRLSIFPTLSSSHFIVACPKYSVESTTQCLTLRMRQPISFTPLTHLSRSFHCWFLFPDKLD
jgi:hypothetical protein